MIKSTLTDTGQTTIPAKVRRALGLKPRQRLVYEIHKEGVFIKPDLEDLMDLYGSLNSYVPANAKKKQREIARKERVSRYL